MTKKDPTSIIHPSCFNPGFIMHTMLSEQCYNHKFTKWVYHVSDILVCVNPHDFETHKSSNPLGQRIAYINSMIPVMTRFFNERPDVSSNIGEVLTVPELLRVGKLASSKFVAKLQTMLEAAGLEVSDFLLSMYVCACAFAVSLKYAQTLNRFATRQDVEFVIEVQMAKAWFSRGLRKKMLESFKLFA